MRRARWLYLCFLLGVIAPATAVPAQPPAPFVPESSSVSAPAGQAATDQVVDFAHLERLEAELAALRERIDRQEAVAPMRSTHRKPSGNTACRRRWYTGFEFTLLKPRFEDGAEEDLDGEMMDFPMRLGPRVWIGYVDPQQAGLRARYWQYDHGSEPAAADHVPIGPGLKRLSIEAHTIDLEVTQAMAFRSWEFTFAAGMRYAHFEERVNSLASTNFVFKRFHGIGPTCCVENRLPLWNTELSLVFSGRGSLLVGESRWASLGASNETDDIASLVDMQLGLQWLRKCDRGRSVYFRFAWEQQHWFGAGTFFDSGPTTPGTIFATASADHDVAFMGPAMALGATW